ncbi:MAG TPA: tetratricopeptide repeat protein [Candidatus Sulfotelmatobacter sp.]|nr:tetratricopeptide repeat protein [Candidatus Sulfotelmatobacter sp.]
MNAPAPDRPNFQILTQRFLSSHQWDRALETAREWLAREPENPRAHRMAGQSLVNLNRYKEAESHLLEALKANPQNDFAWRCLSISQFHQRRFKAADESIQKAISLNPRDAFHWYHLAWMFYRHGDPKSALKYAEKARELAPRNASILNLTALCTPKTRANVAERLEQYHEALALDPENAQVHNNIGVYYLNIKNYAAAEESFRRALSLQPTMKIARSNLFLVLKHRDVLYRVLTAPRDFVLGWFAGVRKRPILIVIYLLALPILIALFEFLVGLFGLWCLIVWPMVKTYEYLTIGDLRAQAGDIGAKRGGIFGYRRWPLHLRMGLFGLLLVGFWGGITLFVIKTSLLNSKNFGEAVLGPIIAIGCVALLVFIVRARLKRGRPLFHWRRKNAHIERLLKQKAGPVDN